MVYFKCFSFRCKRYIKRYDILRIHITFNVDPVKMKISHLLFIFLVKCTYVRKAEQISFLIMVPIKKQVKAFGEINYQTLLWQLKFEG